MSFDKAIQKIGFIGTGNIATAMIKSIISKQLINPLNVFVSDADTSKMTNLKAEIGVNALVNNRQLIMEAKIVFLTIKPNVYETVLEEISDLLSKDHVLVSVAAGITTELIKIKTRNICKIVRTMPNIACLVGEGMTALCNNHGLDDAQLYNIKHILSAFGKVEEVDERLLDAVTAVSGSSPAFVFMFIEALADGGVLMGIPREQAYRLAAQSVLGSAKLFMESNKHPAELKDMVCTPGGTTIQGIHSLELNGFRGVVMDAIQVTTLKSLRMTNENC